MTGPSKARHATTSLAVIPIVLATTLALVAGSGVAAPPQAAGLGELTLQGAPVAVGFLASGYVVLGTADAGGPLAQPQGTPACSLENDDADLYLVTFPNGSVCQAIDVSGNLGQEGIVAMAVAGGRDRVVVGLPPPTTGSANNVAAYELDGEELVRGYRTQVPGTVLALATHETGTRTVVASQDGPNPRTATYRFTVLDANGNVGDSYTLRGQPLSLAMSDNGRFAAVGGNFTQEGSTFGWVNVYDFTRTRSANPVVRQEVRQADAGVVSDLVVTNNGTAFAGLEAGRVLSIVADGLPTDVGIGNGTTQLASNANGTVLVAATSERVARITGFPDDPRMAWSHAVNGSVGLLEVRGDYVFVGADGLSAYHVDGTRLWTTTSSAVMAVNATGLGIAGADTTAAGTAADQAMATLSGAVLHAAVSVTQDGPVPTVSPGDIQTFNVTVRNDGAAITWVSMAADVPTGLNLTQLAGDVELLPGDDRTLPFAIEAGAGAQPGRTTIPLNVTTRPPTNLTTNLTVDVGEATNVVLRLQPGAPSSLAVVQGQRVVFPLVLDNRGNTDADVRLDVLQFPTQGPAWPATFEPNIQVLVERDARSTTNLVVTVPETAANGTRDHIIVRALTSEGTSATSVELTVNPFEALAITPPSVTKLVAPGGQVSFRFTLSNVGTVPSNVTVGAVALDPAGEPFVPTGWAILAQGPDGILAPDETGAITVEVGAPAGGTEGDRLRVQVVAATADGVRATATAFTVVDPTLAEDDEEPKREPLGLVAPLVALAAAAWTRRRTHHGKL